MPTTRVPDHAKKIAAEIEAMGYRVVGDRILVVRDEAIDKTEGGIILPDSSKRKPLRATVVALGSGFSLPDERQSDYALELTLQGIERLDRVLHTKYNPVLLEMAGTDGKTFEVEIMTPRDIFVIL